VQTDVNLSELPSSIIRADPYPPDKHRVGPAQCTDSARKDCKVAFAQALSGIFLKVKTHALGKKRCPAPTAIFYASLT
jgi:hypothetical protein